MADIKLNNIGVDSVLPHSNVSKKIPSKNFMDTMKEVVDEVNLHQKTSEKALSDVATGQVKDLHQAAIAIGKAETSMKVMLEVRNKAINAYKEILRTQV